MVAEAVVVGLKVALKVGIMFGVVNLTNEVGVMEVSILVIINLIFLLKFNSYVSFVGGNWGGSQSGYGGGPMRGNFGNNRAVPYHTGRSNIFSLIPFYIF
jgi:hypothetical protein